MEDTVLPVEKIFINEMLWAENITRNKSGQ